MSKYFFALMPDAGFLEAMAGVAGQQVRDPFKGRAVPAQLLHVTLAFLGDGSNIIEKRPGDEPQRLEALGSMLAEVGTLAAQRARRAFELQFRRSQFWRRADCGVLMPEEEPNLYNLRSRLNDALRAELGWRDYGAWQPHLTLVKPCTGMRYPARLLTRPIVMQCDEFVLVESLGGGNYSIRQRYALERGA